MSSQEIDPELVTTLLKRVNELEERVDDLEQTVSKPKNQSTGSRSGTDGRDQAVLDQLEDGDVVNVRKLKQLYRTNTDIRAKRTLKNRVKSVTNRPEFEYLAPGKWQYVGGDDSE
jgi:uncharacterized protein Yka (UPF0111/DUF47 family)